MNPDRDNREAWRTEADQVQDDLADLPRLRALFQSVAPPEPDEAAWNAVQARLHEACGQSARAPERGCPAGNRWLWLRWVVAGGAAAALLLALLLARSWRTTPVPPPVEEPLPVAEADDVNIVSMDARDTAALVVGEAPVSGELVFARPEDIRVIRCDRCPHSGRFARLEPGEEVPMFVTAAVTPANEN